MVSPPIPPPSHSFPSAGRWDSHLEQHFKNTALSRRASCTQGDAVHHFSRGAIFTDLIICSYVVDGLLHKGTLRWDQRRKSDESHTSKAATLAPNRLASHLISFVPLCFVQNVSAKTSWAALECVFVCEDRQGVASDSSAPPGALLSHHEYAFVLQRHTQLRWTTWEERRTHACAEIEEGVTWHLFIARTLWLHLHPKKQHLQPELLLKHLVLLLCTQSVLINSELQRDISCAKTELIPHV